MVVWFGNLFLMIVFVMLFSVAAVIVGGLIIFIIAYIMTIIFRTVLKVVKHKTKKEDDFK